MTIKKFIKVATLRFAGPLFEDHALDLSAIPDLANFQKMVRATAEALWRQQNPDRSNLPKGFAEEVRLCVREILPGSAMLEIEAVINEDEQLTILPPNYLVAQATMLAYEGWAAIAMNQPPPQMLPRSIIPDMVDFGTSISEGNSLDFSVADKPPVSITNAVRERWTEHLEKSYSEPVQLVGEVYLADLKLRRFGLWVEDGEDARTPVVISLNAEQEDQVLAALRDHRDVRLSVNGIGEKSPLGKLIKIHEVTALAVLTLAASQNTPPTNFDVLDSLFKQFQDAVPKEELSRLPPDLASNIDMYLVPRDS